MPRRPIPFIANQYYHIYNRGNNRERIFFEQANYIHFLRGIKKYVCPVADITAYCLMPTHYHIVARAKDIKTPQVSVEDSEIGMPPEEVSETPSHLTPLSRGMKNFLIAYVKGMNERYGRVGTLFQGVFKAKPVTSYNYLINLCVYIHANPVKDGLVTDPANWPYSNYLEWLGERDGTLVDKEFIAHNFDSPAEYKSLVLNYLKTRQLPDDMAGYLSDLEK